MRVVFFGSGEFGAPSLRWLINSPHEVATVVTQPDRPAGRGKKLVPTPIALKAEEFSLPVERCENVNTEPFVERIGSLQADIGVVIAFGQKMLAPIRSVFPSECVNLHASLLPKFRGAAPIAGTILAGEEKTGVTSFRLVDRMDAGPILIQRQTMIDPIESCGQLHDRLAGVGCDALDATLKLHEANPLPPGEPQDESLATRAPKLSKADGYLQFDQPAEQIVLRCRAMWPWPGGRCRYVSGDGKRTEVTIGSVTAISTPASASPGKLTSVLTVATGAGTLEIHSLKPAGKRLMSWQDFVNGRHVQPGDYFEAIES